MMQAKDNYKVKDAFETLVRKIIAKKPDAGRSEGSGSVFGAGAAARSADAMISIKSIIV